jgi:hypothetical protein
LKEVAEQADELLYLIHAANESFKKDELWHSFLVNSFLAELGLLSAQLNTAILYEQCKCVYLSLYSEFKYMDKITFFVMVEEGSCARKRGSEIACGRHILLREEGSCSFTSILPVGRVR